jgi:hypothetical protein
VIAPHFILSSIKSSRLREFLDTFPNLYSDVSFGHDDFLIAGLKRISRKPGKFKRLLRAYPDRFMFDTDLVVTEHPRKSAAWISERFRAYLNMLAAESYEVEFLPGKRLNGLALSGEAPERILYRNYEDFMAARPRGTRITRAIDWSRMGVAKTGRELGTSIPPPAAGAQQVRSGAGAATASAGQRGSCRPRRCRRAQKKRGAPAPRLSSARGCPASRG